MIEKHQQTNGIGRGKITINPEYIKRAREITVGGLPIKVLSSNPNTGRVLAQFPDGHTEEVKAAPDYFIGGNTSTKELKNNLPIYGETNTAANERADSLDEAHDLTPIFSNLITAGQISTMNEGALDLLNGKYLEGTTKLLSPAMFGSGIGGIAARSGIGGYNLFNKNGVRKTYNLFNLGHYGEGALSLLGDAFNAAMATEGLGSISNTLKGTSGYRNWRLAREINKAIKNKPKYTKVPSKNLFRALVYKGGEITDPYSNFVTTDPLYAANYGKVTPYIFESKSIAKAKEPMMGSSDPVTMDMFVYNNTKRNPNATAIIGHDKVTGEFTPSKGIEILNMNPKNLFKINNSEKGEIFTNFEGQQLLNNFSSAPLPPIYKKPSRISEAERLGVPKGERNLAIKGKPNISITADAGTTTNQGSTALSLEEILKAFNQARQWHLNRINSPGYTNRALRAGFTEEEIPLLQLQLTSLINRLKLINPEELFKKVNIKHNHNYNGKVSAGYWKTINNDGKLLLGIKFDNPNMSYDDAVSTFVHEFGHGATFGLNGNETTGYMKLLSDLFPLLTRVVKYNKTLYPEVNENIVTQVMPKVGNNAGYYAAPTEMLSRGYEFMRDYANNFFKLKNSEGLTTQRVIDNAANTRINSKIFRALTGNLGAFNFLKYALGTSIPVGLGYSLINNNDNLGQQLQSLKQGGKMNILEFLKNGSGIHIKPSQKGSFTKYCKGKVTDECIRRGKNSPNPKIRKKATFADNARHFKHKGGGKAFVNGVNVLDSNPKMYKYNKKYKMAQEGAKLTFWLQAGNWIKDNLDSISTIGNGISNLISAKNRLDEINQFALAKQKELKAFKYKTWKDKYLSNLQNQTDRSDIVNAHNAFNLTNINDALQEKLNEINNLIANLLYLNDLQDTGLGDITSGLLGIATNILLGTAKKKKIDNTFSPLANQTMSQIRGKLLDINANFSE